MVNLETIAPPRAVRTAWLAAGALGLVCSACGGAAPPDQRLSDSTAAVRAAEEVGAESVPQSALHLKLAQEQVDKGRRLIADGDNEEADFVLQRAQADAELAIALAREETTRQQAQQVLEKAGGSGAAGPTNAAQPSPLR